MKPNDKDICSVFKSALDFSTQIMNKARELLDGENQEVPYGFSEQDVNVNAPKVYSDKSMLYTLKIYTAVAMANYGTATSLSPRQDIRKFFTDTLISSIELSNKIDDLLLEKGLYLRTPNVPTTQEVEFAKDKSIMGRIIGHNRPLTAQEITGIFNCSFTDSVSAVHILGFAQTAEDPRLKVFFNRVRKTLKEQTETLNEILNKENLSSTQNLESETLSSTDQIYSDRLSLFCTYATLGDTLTTFSNSKLGVMRKDIYATLSQLSNELLLLIKDAVDLMLDRHWFEEMPKNIERELITK